jgi:hypothetical protein
VKKKQKKIKKNLRARTKFPALKPHLNLKTRYEEIKDVLSYVDQLNEKEKAFLNAFVSEWINADFQHGGKILHKGKKKRKLCTDRNNARNRCELTKARASGNIGSLSDLSQKDESVENIDNVIDVIDLKKNYSGWEDDN